MKKPKSMLLHALNVVTIALIVECFLCAMMAVRQYAREACFARIEEATSQMAGVFTHSMDERRDKLTLFADILAANSQNPDELLQAYMENFCKTQYFSAICIHRADGRITSYGEHPHDAFRIVPFEEEAARLPYVSEVFVEGDQPKERCIYQAVPIIRGGQTIAVLYGYMTLDVMPSFIVSDAYDGKYLFYVADGETGDVLMDGYHETLGNLYDGSLRNEEARDGYTLENLRQGIREGRSGYYIYRSQKSGKWYYTYYMPLGINSWSMQLTVDEETALDAYEGVNKTMLVLMICVVVLMFTHVIVLMMQTAQTNQKDRARLHQSAYISEVQRALLNAHSNPDFVDQALKIVAEEMEAETVLLLSFSDKMVSNAQYWPSKDKAQAMHLMGRNIRDDFPNLFDLLSAKKSVLYDQNNPAMALSETAQGIFEHLEVSNIALVPIMDTAGALKGVLVAANMAKVKCLEALECVTYDFFMAITNLENHNIIKRMGAMDYLTNTKNRNSYESELGSYATIGGDNLWCVFVDVNGLHEVNNAHGHKAGDLMLCAVADAVKRMFGEKRTYRLGGDEFVAFVPNSTREEFLRRKDRITAELAAKGYYVSIGFEGTPRRADGTFDVEYIVAEAEALMYKDKWAYYVEHNIPSERGHFPQMSTLEQREKLGVEE